MGGGTLRYSTVGCRLWWYSVFDLQEPLNSADDVSEEDPTELFDSDNVIVCQYDKVSEASVRFVIVAM